MFTEWLKINQFSDLVKDVHDYHPYPSATEREKWKNVSEEAANICIREAKKYIGFQWPSLTAVDFMAFMRTGDRKAYENHHFPRRKALAALVLGECVEGKGRFIDDIINGIWCICEESFWGVSAHNGVRPNELLPDVENRYIDLFAAETGALLAWTKYLLSDKLNKITHRITRRIDIELEDRIKKPFIQREDFWWMGVTTKKVNNWTPWVIANVMSVFLLNEYDQIRRVKALEKMMRCLDLFMDTYHDDGGCDEGTTYWGVAGGALFDCLDQLYLVSDGKIDFFTEDLVRQIGRFIYRCHIADQYFINFSDGSAKVDVAKDMIYRFGKRIQDEHMMSFAVSVPSNSFFCTEAPRRALPAVFNYEELTSKKTKPPYTKDVWMDGIQVMVAREKEGSPEGLYLAAKGGHNGESHNHNDVGSFIVFVDGLPGIIDIGVETYTKKTFSSNRYDIWTMQSRYHNVPTINGMMQQPGEEYGASNVLYSMTDEVVAYSVDIQNAYPKVAKCLSYNRTYRMKRGENCGEKSLIEITDTFAFENENNVISLNFMIWKRPEIIDDECDITELVQVSIDENTRFFMEYDKKDTKTDIEHCNITDEQLKSVWGNEGIYRMTITKTVLKEGSFSVRIFKR